MVFPCFNKKTHWQQMKEINDNISEDEDEGDEEEVGVEGFVSLFVLHNKIIGVYLLLLFCLLL